MTVHMVVLKRPAGTDVLGVFSTLQAAYDKVADLPANLQIHTIINTYPVDN